MGEQYSTKGIGTLGMLVFILVFSGLAVQPNLYAATPACSLVQSITIADRELIEPADKKAILQPYLSRCLGAVELQQLLHAISEHFFAVGFVTTRPYFLQQDISDGELEISVSVGTVEVIVDKFTGETTSQIASAFSSHTEVLNLRNLEQALEILQRPPSVEANFTIEPGTRPGNSKVVVDTQIANRTRVDVSLVTQTDFNDQLSLNAAFDNPLARNDIVEFRINSGELQQTLQTSESFELSYSLPVFSHLTTLTVGQSAFEQKVQGISGPLQTEGETQFQNYRLERPLQRDQRRSSRLSLSLEFRDTTTFIEGELVDVSSYKTSQLQLDYNKRWLFPAGQLTARFGLRQGLEINGARRDAYYTLDEGFDNAASLQFSKWILDARATLNFGQSGRQMDFQFHHQFSDDVLFSSDRINLGSPSTVRGYNSALSGSNGAYFRSTLRQGFNIAGLPSDAISGVNLSAGLDLGWVKCEQDNPDLCGEIAGLGLEVQIHGPKFSGQLIWGVPLIKLSSATQRDDQVMLSLNWSLN